MTGDRPRTDPIAPTHYTTTQPQNRAQRLVFRSFTSLNAALDKYAPATDAECDWRWASLSCEPREECRFYYKVCLCCLWFSCVIVVRLWWLMTFLLCDCVIAVRVWWLMTFLLCDCGDCG